MPVVEDGSARTQPGQAPRLPADSTAKRPLRGTFVARLSAR
jgi:hypothetical protein